MAGVTPYLPGVSETSQAAREQQEKERKARKKRRFWAKLKLTTAGITLIADFVLMLISAVNLSGINASLSLISPQCEVEGGALGSIIMDGLVIVCTIITFLIAGKTLNPCIMFCNALDHLDTTIEVMHVGLGFEKVLSLIAWIVTAVGAAQVHAKYISDSGKCHFLVEDSDQAGVRDDLYTLYWNLVAGAVTEAVLWVAGGFLLVVGHEDSNCCIDCAM